MLDLGSRKGGEWSEKVPHRSRSSPNEGGVRHSRLPASEAIQFALRTAMEWLYYVPGWESTLTELDYGTIYVVIVSDACTWEIPQP